MGAVGEQLHFPLTTEPVSSWLSHKSLDQHIRIQVNHRPDPMAMRSCRAVSIQALAP
jgi:hypothetical protein